ncbi:MAG: hypothetical protein A2Y07_04430 [Planctomycetes bacterium GWF2_50_10]|nr:MAG: hypothetical protein A2Y07_04430 [Planctomycetes bacterium GWF2_50_10]
MPIFEYKCKECGKVSEFLVNGSSSEKNKCGHCGSGKLEKMFSTFAPKIKEGQSKKCHGCMDGGCPHAGH